MSNTPVLIVGAGPTGLVLALSLARRGVAFRIISEADGPGQHSRAMVVHARTLEFYRQFGFADAVVANGIKLGAAHMREADKQGSHELTSVSFADLGEGISPFPFALCYPQDDHEHFLVDKLRELGVEIEWQTRLESFTQDDNSVNARLTHLQGDPEETAVDYICGCDGAHSAVRQTLKMDFPGGTYDQLFYVADVALENGFNTDLQITMGDHIFVLRLPVRSREMQRLIGLVPTQLSNRTDLKFDDIRSLVEPMIGARVTNVNWFSTYRVHHRVAARFRVGRAFLLGDAGHIHSPAGGQGMNTGIGDAINLGWKLAHVVSGRADALILDSYEAERIGFARSLVETTDRAFTPLVASGIKGEVMRRVIAPLFFSVATRLSFARHTFFRILSQTRIHYDHSILSEGKAGDVHGGDRLPWVAMSAERIADGKTHAGTSANAQESFRESVNGRTDNLAPPDAFDSQAHMYGTDNYSPLDSLDWQVHVYGTVSSEMRTACNTLQLSLHEFAYSDACDKAGLKRDALYLVRPDGYVALAVGANAVRPLQQFVERLRLRMS